MAQRKSQILIADDSVDFCGILNDIVSQQPDMEVSGIAYNGKSALDMLNEKEPDVVILDIKMPIISGLEVMNRYLRTHNIAKTKFVILSAALMNREYQNELLSGASYVCLKPIELDVLMDHIRCII